MSIYEIIISYVIAWWLVFFMALPFGASPPRQPGRGHAESAPETPRLWMKAGISSVVAAVLVAAFYWFVTSGIVTLRP